MSSQFLSVTRHFWRNTRLDLGSVNRMLVSSSLGKAESQQVTTSTSTQRATSATMSEKHLESGQPLPALKDGSIRLFSMKYCPFAQRPRLVLKAKGLDYEEINCNLTKKPEFLLERHPDGKVPVFEHNGKVVVESNVICDLLDEVYPQPALYPDDPFQKAKDKITMETYSSKVIPAFYQSLRSGGQNEEAAAKLYAALAVFEADLKQRGTPFLGGQQPGMVDFNTWPFNERITVSDSHMARIAAELPGLGAYYQRMAADPTVKAVSTDKEIYLKFFEGYRTGTYQYDF